MNKKLNILLLSSISPYRSANLGLDTFKSLEEAGHNVDLITKHRFDGMSPRMFSIYNTYEPQNKLSLRGRLKKMFPFLGYLNPVNYFRKRSDYCIVNKIEKEPAVEVSLIIDKIDKIQNKYDLVITLFWYSMMTAETLKHVYEKLKCPIFIQAVDMHPMTGGCFYFRDCRRFLNACGKCPGLFSDDENDQTHINFLVKKEIYASIRYVYIGNTWMCEWARKTHLFDPAFIKRGGVVINQDVFLDVDKREARKSLGLPASKKFIIFSGAASLRDKRKGPDVLVKSVNAFYEKLSPEEKEQTLLVLAGRDGKQIQKYIQMDVYSMNFLNAPQLALTYAAADVYLSTTIEDAGPSMVNQALMCGTPVVAFEIGVALDIVEIGETGYRAKHLDIDDFAQGIWYLYNLDAEKRMQMSRKCREIALQESSYASFAARIARIYQEIKDL